MIILELEHLLTNSIMIKSSCVINENIGHMGIEWHVLNCLSIILWRHLVPLYFIIIMIVVVAIIIIIVVIVVVIVIDIILSLSLLLLSLLSSSSSSLLLLLLLF